MKINKRQIGLITDTVSDLFYRLKARLLGRFFTGSTIHFDVLTDTDPMDTLEGAFVFTVKTLYGPGASVDEDMLKQLCDITSNFIEAQRLKAVNHALNTAKQAETVAELATGLTNTLEQSGNYVNMLTNTQTRVVQVYAEKSGIQQLSASMGIDDATVIFMGVNDSLRCKHCRKMYSDPANARRPIPYKLSQLREGYFKPKEWDGVTPFMAPLHPHCFSKDTEVLTDGGWKLFPDLTGSEEFLSMNMDTGAGEWVRSVKSISYLYDGPLIHFSNNATDLAVTPNHINPIVRRHRFRTGSTYTKQMVSTESLLDSGEWGFITTLEHWEGDTGAIVLDGIEYDRALMCEFMGYFLSEGFIRKGSTNTFRIEICQKKHPQPMIDCMKKLFARETISYSNEKIVLGRPMAQIELYNFLSRRKSWEKYIPAEIKQSSIECLRVFLNAYMLGDGTTRTRCKLPGQKIPSTERVFFTSSDRMAADIGEIMLKVGSRPSYSKEAARWITHWNGTYLTKHPCWRISQNSGGHPRKGNLCVEHMPYNDMVYDVELERNHTLFVRRNGKVQLSGNCRDVMSMVPPNFTMRANGVIAFKAFGYDYYSDYHGMAKSEMMYESHSDAFIGFDEFIQYNMEHPCECGCEEGFAK